MHFSIPVDIGFETTNDKQVPPTKITLTFIGKVPVVMLPRKLLFDIASRLQGLNTSDKIIIKWNLSIPTH